MWKFIKKFSILVLLIFISDFFIGKITQHFYFKVKSGDVYDVNYGIKSCDEDILILGASEVARSIVSNQLTDSLGLSCYNFGRDGNNIYNQYFLLENILNRYQPKLIIISTTVLEESDKTINNFLPYIGDNNFAKSIVKDIDLTEYYKSFCRSYCYNSSVIKIAQGNLSRVSNNLNGYKPLYERNNKSNHLDYPEKPYKMGLSERTLSYYRKFLNLCNSKGVKVVVLSTPKYAKNFDKVEEQQINNLIKDYNCTYLDFSKDSTIYTNSSIFKDVTHLNNDGAVFFTGILASQIKKIL